ncbi:hypothetical protein MUCCIDRAFT_164849 [Mucor lusitanicus CBS 277.49]|uniref:Uncharacterized protein n=1 Tax=Mucor lusitanicus CBS 277.49 TaxID=747725 RepID=A0A168J9Q1_MUCCL|nr:hypothetical protein MUCCIDRAFT_164849 [Mucor lusitanicus CBS 277.49]
MDERYRSRNHLEVENTLDLYLLHQPTEGTYEVIKTWPGQERTKGVLVQHIDNSWYPSQISDNSPNVSWTMYFYIVGADYDIQTDLALIPTQHNFFPVPQIFTLIQISRNTTATTPSTTTMSSSPTSTPSSVAAVTSGSNNGNKKLPGWAIAVIVIASLLFIAAVAALIWAYKRYKKRSNTNRRNEASFTSEKPQLGLNSDAHQSSSILSSTDALMIADTFRQFMRKPEWNEELELQKQQQKQGAGGDGTEAGGDATTTTAATTTRSEEERKRLGDQLLERQLKKEGTQVQSIDKFNH